MKPAQLFVIAPLNIGAAVLVATLALASRAADDAKPPPEKENSVKHAAKVVGHDAKTAAHQAANAAKETGKAIGEGTKKTVKEIGHAMAESAAKTKKAAKETFK